MQVTTRILFCISIYLVIIIACGTQTDPNPREYPQVLADYKSNSYGISLGDSYKLNKIDWHWAPLNDPDNKIDSTGADAFFYLEEPMISYNNNKWLPALHIHTNKNIITSFTYSILFDLAEHVNAKEVFLDVIGDNFKKLRMESVRNTIIAKGKYVLESEKYIETYQLTASNDNNYDKFEYTIKIR